MTATLTEIATKIGISSATVSRAINHPEMVSGETLERVQKVLADIDYTPTTKGKKRGPKGPKKKKSELKTIGIWFVSNWSALGNSVQDHLVLGFQKAFEMRGYATQIVTTQTRDEFPEKFLSGKLEGLVIQGLPPTRELLDRLKDMPKVWMMTQRINDYPIDYVQPDNTMNGRLAASYLNGEGHTKLVAVVSDPDYPAFVRRKEAFLAEAERRNCSVEVIEGPRKSSPALVDKKPSSKTVCELAKAFGKLNDVPRGFYFPSDFTTSQILQALPVLGLEMQPNSSIISGDYNAILYPQSGSLLACIDIHSDTIIDKTAEQLCWRIKNPDAKGQVAIRIVPTLVLPT